MRRMISMLIILCLALSAVGNLPQVYAYAQDEPTSAAANDMLAGSLQDSKDVSLDIKGLDVVEVIKMLADKGNLNVVVGNDVKGRVTIFLKSVKLMDAFDIILMANDLAYDKRGDIIYVMSQQEYERTYGERYADKKEVRIFQLKFAKAAEASKALTQMKTKIGKIIIDESSNTIIVIDSPLFINQISEAIERLDSPTATRVFELKYAKAADLKTKISETLTRGVGTMQIDERTNKIIVTDLEKKLGELQEMVTAFDEKLQQVLIESKIVQITLDDKHKLGVDWDNVINNLQRQISIKSAFQLAAENALVPGGQLVIGALGQATDYAIMVQALKTIGDTNLLSSPRITVLNNSEAKILIGKTQPYATNTVTQGTSTTTTATNLQFIDIGVKLYVTPSVNKDNFVTMKIRPEVSSSTQNYTYGDPATTVPVVETTQAETCVTVKNGTTIIIAGLIKDERTSQVDTIPILGELPLIKHIFRKTVKEIVKQELVIFLTPHIVTGEKDYLEQPMSPPIGEKKFTEPERPTFQRRDGVEMKPGMFKGKKAQDAEKKESPAEAKAEEDKLAKTVPASSPEEYYYLVKEKISQNMVIPQNKMRMPDKGSVRIQFFLSSSGDISSNPEVLQSSNGPLAEAAINAVRKSAPFPAFPGATSQAQKRFVIDFSFE